ncbi:unnamed protein product [Sphenostylis stenocarpa]|uniref:Uncharacterized protein n=1 Tax=Sphenostylis stenocarpa TaxID=92480 RepID=A0AA86TBI7_9FABA|nr:unnamed protein product [Sphenostylis stenocarpa]
MGLNVRDIQFRLSKVLHVSTEISYSFMRKHPFVSGASLVFFILYIFLSYIYNLLVFLSPFFVCIAIFIRIFWSSEQNQHEEKEKKGKEKRVEIKSPPKVLKNERRGLLYKCPSHNATSRRRNFTGKKLEVYGGLEMKAKDLSSVFHNEFTTSNRDFGRIKLYKEDISIHSLEAPTKQTLLFEPFKLDLMSQGDGLEKKTENKVDLKQTKEDGDKSVELKEDDLKNEMDLGPCELERHKRLQSLIARRKARKQMKSQIANGLADMKSVTPSQIAPLFVTRLKPFDSQKEFDDIEMPGSAPSALRSPFDIPYDPFEEKPNLTGDSFDLELKDLLIQTGQEDLEVKGHTMTLPRDKRLQGRGSNNLLEQLLLKEANACKSKVYILSKEGKETTLENDKKCEIDKMVEEVDNAQATKTMSDHEIESDLIPRIDVDIDEVSEKLKESIIPKSQVMDQNLPISSASATKINDSLYESLSPPVGKNQETKFTSHPIRHTPSCSLASDLQVEVSELGSPTLTVDENHEATATTDGESVIYDGDIDKDVTSGSEDMWGASIHSRDVRRISEQDISEVHSWRDISSPLSLQNIDEENAADVSSMSSRSDMPDDTPTYGMSSDHNNIFGNVKDFVIGPSHSSVVTARWKRLMRLMDNRANHSPHEMHSKQPRKLFNVSQNLSKEQIINDGNNLTTSEQDNTHNSRGNEEPSAFDLDMQQKVNDEVSINSSSTSSPRSVLLITQKNIADQVPSSTYNQETHVDVQQSNIRDVTQEILNGEGSIDSTPQNIQPTMKDANVESHNIDLGHPQEESYQLKNSIQESNICSEMKDAKVCNLEDENQLKNNEDTRGKLTPLIIVDALAEVHRQANMMMSSKDISEESREIFDHKVPLISLILESSLKSPGEDEENPLARMREESITKSCISVETITTSSDEDYERKHSTSEDHTKNGNLGKGGTFKNYPSPSTIEVTNFQDMEGECDKMNKNEVIDKELNKNDIVVISKSTRVNNSEENISHMKDLEETNYEDREGEHDRKNKNEATDQELNMKKTMVVSNPTSNSDQIRTIEDLRVTNFEETEGEQDKTTKNEATDLELDKNETITMFEKARESEQAINISHMNDLEVTNFEDPKGEHDKINKNETPNKELNKNETMIILESTIESDQTKTIANMKDFEVTNYEDPDGEHDKINNNGVTYDELNNKEIVVILEPTKGSDQKKNITNMKDLGVTNSEIIEGEGDKINMNEATYQEVNNNEIMIISEPTIEIHKKKNVTNIKDLERSNYEDTEGEYDKINNNGVTCDELNNNETVVIHEPTEESDQKKHITNMENLEVTNFENIVGGGDKMNKNEVTYQEVNNNETMITFEPIIESHEKKNVTNMKDLERTSYEDIEGKHDKMNKNEGTYQELNNNQTTNMFEPTIESHQEKNMTNMKDLEVTNYDDTKGECDKMNKNEVPDHELNKNETMVMFEPMGDSDKVRNIAQMEDFEVSNVKDTKGEHDKIRKNEATNQELDQKEVINQELHKNEAMDQESNKNEIIDQESNKNEVTDQELDKNGIIVMTETTEENDQVRNIEHMEDVEVTNYENTKGECDKMKKNEIIDQELNNNETMVIFDPVEESDKIMKKELQHEYIGTPNHDNSNDSSKEVGWLKRATKYYDDDIKDLPTKVLESIITSK